MIRTYYILAILIGLSFWAAPVFDPDLGWQLLGGQLIWQNHSLPTFDPINTFNTSWLDYHWLGQILFYGIYKIAGFSGLRFCFGLLMAYIFKILLDIVCLSTFKTKSPILLLLLSIFSVALLYSISSIRPQMLALCILALCMRRLIQEPTAWEKYFIFVLTVVLVNIHVYWIFIPFLWFALRTFKPLLHKNYDLANLKFFIVLLACGLLSPYSIQNYWLIWDYAHTSAYMNNAIAEFRSSLSAQGNIPALFIFSLILIFCTLRPKRFWAQSSQLLLTLSSLFLAYRSVKFISIFLIFSLPYFTRSLSLFLKRLLPTLYFKEIREIKLALYIIIAASLVVAVRFNPISLNNDHLLYEMYPIKACSQIANELKNNHDKNQFRVLTHFNDGGWCRWSIYQEAQELDARVTTDGRTQSVPEQQFKDSFDLYALKENWQDTLNKWAPDAIVSQNDRALAQALKLMPNWKQIYNDQDFSAWIKQAN